MSQATANPHRHEPQARRALGILFVAVAVAASLMTAAVLSNSPHSAEQPDASVAPAAPVVAAASPGTGVPEASTVFGDKYVPVEEPVPTF